MQESNLESDTGRVVMVTRSSLDTPGRKISSMVSIPQNTG